ncbi:hypothetical protein [Kutzneria sp. 744]|uniref:hypothetical protein n=1 Tax=Kutzneria sp. (strain 744) TaxID=345341 RepID=UPI0004B5C342|nr:hypothetical protein [Kutzneria sp. 744]
MLILCDRETGEPYVIEVASPGTSIAVVDVSDFHVTVEFAPKHGGVAVRLVMDYEAAGRMAAVTTEAIRPRPDLDALRSLPLSHDARCDCGSCPLRPVPAGDEDSPDK